VVVGETSWPKVAGVHDSSQSRVMIGPKDLLIILSPDPAIRLSGGEMKRNSTMGERKN
jgi:hypothetical protein